jgi:hypothetical protein
MRKQSRIIVKINNFPIIPKRLIEKHQFKSNCKLVQINSPNKVQIQICKIINIIKEPPIVLIV